MVRASACFISLLLVVVFVVFLLRLVLRIVRISEELDSIAVPMAPASYHSGLRTNHDLMARWSLRAGTVVLLDLLHSKGKIAFFILFLLT
jgi:hypothetical protein